MTDLLGDICAQYHIDSHSGMVSLRLLPNGMQGEARKKPQEAVPLMQLMIRGSDFPGGFANGHTLRSNASVGRFRFARQTKREDGEATRVLTALRSAQGQQLTHQLTHCHGYSGVKVVTSLQNGGEGPVTLDMLSSFCLGSMYHDG